MKLRKIISHFVFLAEEHKKGILILVIFLILGIFIRFFLNESFDKTDISYKDAISLLEGNLFESFYDIENETGCITVSIEGAVTYPGKYDVEYNSRLFDLVEYAGGFTEKADTDRIRANYYLKNGKSYYIPKKPEKITVTINGAVKNPQTLSVVEGSKLLEVIESIGGFTLDADKRFLKNYYLKDDDVYSIPYRKKSRTGKRKTENNLIIVSIEGEVNQPGQYKLSSGSRLDSLINVAGGLTENADDIILNKNYYLKNNQTFYVKKKKSKRLEKKKHKDFIYVEITGAIRKPGVYKLRKGLRFNALVKKAGGFRSNARKNRLKNYLLKSGQSFFVPYKK